MKNKISIFIIILVILIIGLGVGYLITKNGEIKPAEEEGIATDTEETEEPLSEEQDFSINMPEGWSETYSVPGIITVITNTEEETTNPLAQEIDFKSYFSIAKEDLAEEDYEDFIGNIKDEFYEFLPNLLITKEDFGEINEKNAYFMEIELEELEIVFNVLLVFVEGEENDVWVMSFNTISDKWEEYKDLFYQTAESFKIVS